MSWAPDRKQQQREQLPLNRSLEFRSLGSKWIFQSWFFIVEWGRLFLLTSALAAVSNLHFFDDHHHFITHSSCHYSPLTHFIIRSRASAGGVVWGGGWVGGWVGGIMTFGTTTGHIVSVDDHHHFITHSSCHYSPLTHFIIRSRTSAWRVWYGGGVGGWVGGWGG